MQRAALHSFPVREPIRLQVGHSSPSQPPHVWTALRHGTVRGGGTSAPGEAHMAAPGPCRLPYGAAGLQGRSPNSPWRTQAHGGYSGPGTGCAENGRTPTQGQAAAASSVVTVTLPPPAGPAPEWPSLQPPFTYHATAEDAQSNTVPTGLSPIWKMLLLSDGSVTRHLQLLSGSPVSVECLSMRNVGMSLEGLPPGTELIPGPRVQRQVLLRCLPVGPAAVRRGASSTPDGASGPSRSGSSASSSRSSSDSGSRGSIGGAGDVDGSCGAPGRSGSANSGCTTTSGGCGEAQTSRSMRDASTATTFSNGSSNSDSSSGINSDSSSSSSSSSSRIGEQGDRQRASGGSLLEGNAGDSDARGIGGSDSGRNGGSGSGKPSGTPLGLPLVYASSWWNADTVDEYLRDKSKPIWMSLSQGHVELYREVHALFRGCNPQLEELLGCEGPFWGRQYIFWSGGRPLTLIYEVFSPRLREYLGPAEEEL